MPKFARNHAALALLLTLSMVTTLPAIDAFAALTHQRTLVSVPSISLFGVLFFWISFGFWMAVAGFIVCTLRALRPAIPVNTGATGSAQTAVIMPIYNEDPARAVSALLAMRDGILRAGHGANFEFFLLSDTTDPDIWLREELAWAELAGAGRGPCPIFYRRRVRNVGSKSGNIADFCKRWGRHYTYMMLLDADSLMSARTLIEMVRRMQADPKLGLLQSPPVPINRSSLFARLQQFAAGVYGPIYTAGYALWSGDDGNYWGHNAMIRVSAFLACCGLPRLPGRPPLGGEIMSHDFVEAALMRRAGWKVRLADDLAGSYEECPTNLVTHAKRDQRWCQGNLQHIQLLTAPGLHPLSRIHFTIGVMSYLGSPLWLLLILLSLIAAAAHASGAEMSGEAVTLYAITMSLLLFPRVLAYALLLMDGPRRRDQGGAARVAAGILIETGFSVLIAPIQMLSQTVFVAAALIGKTVRWDSQSRGEEHLSWAQAWRAHRRHTQAGALATAAVLLLAPGLFWWMFPVLLGALVSAPLSILLSSPAAGRKLRDVGLLLIAQETRTPAVVRRQEGWLRQAAELLAGADPFIRIVLDPVLNELHTALLKATAGDHGIPTASRTLRLVALHGGPAWLQPAQKLTLLSDARAMRWLHHAAWRHWPDRLLNPPARASA